MDELRPLVRSGGVWLKSKDVALVVFALLNVVLASEFGALPASAAVIRIPGVGAGDWARYDVAFEFSTNDPSPPVTPPPREIADMEYYQLAVLSVVGSNVTFQLTVRFENGTEMSNAMWANVDTGYPMGPPYLFIAANLSAGDALFSSLFSPTINATLLRTYAGAQREVNLLRLEQNTTGPYGYSATGRISVYWDRASGIVDEMVYEINYTKVPEGYETYAFVHLLMRETDIWSLTYVNAELAAYPRCLNLRSNGKWITVFVDLPESCNVRKVDVSSIMLNGSVHAEKTAVLLDLDGDRRLELMVKFDRQAVIDLISKTLRYARESGTATLTVTGELKDGSVFRGNDTITVIYRMPRTRAITE